MRIGTGFDVCGDPSMLGGVRLASDEGSAEPRMAIAAICLRMRGALCATLAVALWFAVPPALAAASPGEAARGYAEAQARRDHVGMAAQMRPADLKLMRRVYTKRLGKPGGDRLRLEAFAGRDDAAVAKLSDAQFGALMFSWQDRVNDDRGVVTRIDAVDVLGTVAESESVAWVVVKQRGSINDRPLELVEAKRTVREDGQWLMGLNGEALLTLAILEEAD